MTQPVFPETDPVTGALPAKTEARFSKPSDVAALALVVAGKATPEQITTAVQDALDVVAETYVDEDQLAAAVGTATGVTSITYNGDAMTGAVVIDVPTPVTGNLYCIFGATTARVDPVTGQPIPAGGVVQWLADSPPINIAAGDIFLLITSI